MKYIKLNSLNWKRFFVIALCCVTLLFSYITPALAAGATSQPRPPEEGEVQLHKIYETSEDALRQPPMSLDKITKESNKGINEVQGAADINQMKRPSNSRDAVSFEEQVEHVLEKVANK